MFTKIRRSAYVFMAIAFVSCVGLSLPLLSSRPASAAQITSRSLTISSGVPSQTSVIYSYSFTIPTAGTIQSMQFESCTTAVGTCTPPTGQNINQGSQQGSNTFTTTTAFTRDGVGGGACTPANNVLCITRTEPTSETANAKTISWNTQTNPSTANTAFFIRMTTYSDAAWGTPVDTGTVASAVVQTLTVTAYVAEVLNFCVGSTVVDDATTSVASDCTAVSGTSLNIGTLDTTSINVSPINTNGGDNKNGVAMIRTNASNGALVTYAAIQQSGTNHQGAMRITGTTCTADGTPSTSNIDPCINSAGTSQTSFSAGTEKFGMTIAAVNCGSTTSYTCNYGAGTYNLVRNSNYDGDGANTYGTGQGFAWDETGTFQTVASSASSTVKQIDDETLILKFAATPNITTPFGTYTAQADFVAIPTY